MALYAARRFIGTNVEKHPQNLAQMANFYGAILRGADLTGAEVSGLNLLTLADFKGVRVTDEQVFLLLDAMGVDVRTRQR